MKIVSHRPFDERETPFRSSFVGGAWDGVEFTYVMGVCEDGSLIPCWVCNVKEGYFKQVFVPWEMEIPSVV